MNVVVSLQRTIALYCSNSNEAPPLPLDAAA